LIRIPFLPLAIERVPIFRATLVGFCNHLARKSPCFSPDSAAKGTPDELAIRGHELSAGAKPLRHPDAGL